MNRIKKAVISGAATALLAGTAMVGMATAADASPQLPARPFSCSLLEKQAQSYYDASQYYHQQGVYYSSIGNPYMATFMFSYERAMNINWLNVQVC
jgi:hypothetical protein